MIRYGPEIATANVVEISVIEKEANNPISDMTTVDVTKRDLIVKVAANPVTHMTTMITADIPKGNPIDIGETSAVSTNTISMITADIPKRNLIEINVYCVN